MSSAKVMAGLALLLGLAACTSATAGDDSDGPPRSIPEAKGEPGSPVTLQHSARKGAVVKVRVQPLPMTACTQVFTLEGPSGELVPLTTLDPTNRLDEDGVWSWTYEPCPGDEATYSLIATPVLEHPLSLDGPAVDLDEHATYTDGATFEVPAAGRVILLGPRTSLVGPEGAVVLNRGEEPVVFQDGVVVAPVAPDELGAFTVVGAGGDVRLVSPTSVDAEVDGPPVALDPVDVGDAGEYAVEFSVADETWVSARLTGWAAGEEALADPTGVVIEPLEGQPDPARTGAPWHLAPGAHVARVSGGEPGDSATFELSSMVPTVVDEAERSPCPAVTPVGR